MLIREARRRASSNLSVADGINWLGTTTVTVSRMKLSQNHDDSKHKQLQGCKQNHNKNASYLHLLLAIYIARGTKAFLTQFIYLCVMEELTGILKTWNEHYATGSCHLTFQFPTIINNNVADA
jgi:hypothetical protein